MASSSSSWNYHVFLSFRGQDARRGFICHLYDNLKRSKIRAFMDETGIERGEEISAALLQAIERSRIALVIFSPDYASSRWCLDELLKIMECRRSLAQVVIPIFYGVCSSDVCDNERGKYATAMELHEQKFERDQVMRWREALTAAANIAGFSSTKCRNDNQLVKKIVEDVSRKLRKRSKKGLTIGLLGMEGISKTNAAKAINKIGHQFRASNFLANRRENNSKHAKDKVNLQKQLKSNTPKIQVFSIPHDTDRGKRIIQERFPNIRAFFACDDVDSVNQQMNSLCGSSHERFCPGSAIIITTRDLGLLDVLKAGYVSFPGHEGRAQDIFPSLIWSWMSPNNINQSPIEELKQSISFTFSDRWNSGVHGLSPFLGDLVKLRGLWKKCRPWFQLHGKMARLLDALYETNFMESESTRDPSSEGHDQLHIARPAEYSFNSLLLQLGVCDKAGSLKEKILQGCKYGGWDDSHLPGDQYPDWFVFKSEGSSVIFKVPQLISCHLKAMLLNVGYSSCMDNTMPQFLINVLIINQTKETVKNLKGDLSTFHEDAEWQSIISSFQPGDLVELIVLSTEPEFPIKKISAYLIYDGSKPRRLSKSSLSQKLIWFCHIVPVLLICAAIFRKGK